MQLTYLRALSKQRVLLFMPMKVLAEIVHVGQGGWRGGWSQKLCVQLGRLLILRSTTTTPSSVCSVESCGAQSPEVFNCSA